MADNNLALERSFDLGVNLLECRRCSRQLVHSQARLDPRLYDDASSPPSRSPGRIPVTTMISYLRRLLLLQRRVYGSYQS